MQKPALEIFTEPNNVGFAQPPGSVSTNGNWTAKQLINNVFMTVEGGRHLTKLLRRQPGVTRTSWFTHSSVVELVLWQKLIMLPSTFDFANGDAGLPHGVN